MSPALPTAFCKGRTLSRCVSRSRSRAPLLRHRLESMDAMGDAPSARRPSDSTVASTVQPWSWCVPHTGRFITSAAWLSSSPTAASTRPSAVRRSAAHVFAAFPGGISPRASCVPLTAPSCVRFAGRSLTPHSAASPQVSSQRCDPWGELRLLAPPVLPEFTSLADRMALRKGGRIHRQRQHTQRGGNE